MEQMELILTIDLFTTLGSTYALRLLKFCHKIDPDLTSRKSLNIFRNFFIPSQESSGPGPLIKMSKILLAVF